MHGWSGLVSMIAKQKSEDSGRYGRQHDESYNSSHHAQVSAGNPCCLMQLNIQHMFRVGQQQTRQRNTMWRKEGCPFSTSC